MASATDLSRYLDAIVAITRHRDPYELAAAVLDTLKRQVPAERVRLLAIANDNRDTEFNGDNIAGAVVYDYVDPGAAEPTPLDADADLLACIQTQAPVESARAGQRRMVFPVFGAHRVWALVAIEGLRDPSPPRELLTKLLAVYSNQAFILSRSEVDPLTGLHNRQSFYERVRRVASRAGSQRRADDNGKPQGHCFALFDIDHFKEVNDRFGHVYGDEVLLLLARLTTRSFRHGDLLFRYGGEEFAVVLVNVDLDTAEGLLNRFRIAVEAYKFPQLEPKTVSIGYTALTVESGLDKMIMCADKALYYAKNNGRNLVCCYEKLVAEQKLEAVAVAAGDIELF